jgi:hypothetical protein
MRSAIITYTPWLLSAFTIAVMVLAGNKHRSTWIVGLIAQAFWIIWICASENWGLFPSSIALVAVYVRNHIKWLKPAGAAT